jgi:hypothetical protein
MVKTLIVEIDSDGEVKIDAIGFKGTACEKATKAIEDALGVPSSRRKKPEYNISGTTAATQKVGGK